MSDNKIYKVYQLKKRYISYTLYRMIKGQLHTIEFKGGTNSPIYYGGMYSTENIDIQNDLESLPEYNDLFHCIYSSETKQEPAAVLQNIIEEKTPPPPQQNVVTGVKNSVEAKKYLNESLGVPHSQMPNVKAVLDIAIANNIIFPDWKTS